MQQPPKTNLEETSSYSELVVHLLELRKRLALAFACVFIIFLILVYWAPQIYTMFSQPLSQKLAMIPNSHMVFGDVAGSFLIPIKVTFFVALIIGLPWVFYQAWAFVAPGLYQNEKKLILPLILSSYIFFLLGIAFVYFAVLPIIFEFLATYSAKTNTPMLTQANEYLDFVLQMCMSFGIVFEIPVIVIVLVRMHIVEIEKLYKLRPYVIVGAFIISAILTPPDPVSQILMAIPICVLYQLGLWVAKKWYVHTPNEL
jgi:sec-independent protein translocase protein TatC